MNRKGIVSLTSFRSILIQQYNIICNVWGRALEIYRYKYGCFLNTSHTRWVICIYWDSYVSSCPSIHPCVHTSICASCSSSIYASVHPCMHHYACFHRSIRHNMYQNHETLERNKTIKLQPVVTPTTDTWNFMVILLVGKENWQPNKSQLSFSKSQSMPALELRGALAPRCHFPVTMGRTFTLFKYVLLFSSNFNISSNKWTGTKPVKVKTSSPVNFGAGTRYVCADPAMSLHLSNCQIPSDGWILILKTECMNMYN